MLFLVFKHTDKSLHPHHQPFSQQPEKGKNQEKILITELSQVNNYLRKIESKDSDESYGVLDIHSFINASI